MPLRELFHFMQIVDDFDAAQSFYDDLFAPETFMAKSWSDFDKRWASLGNIGPDFVLEIMEPSVAPEDGNSPLPKFHQRHGQHWHSFSWFVDADDMAGLIGRLRDNGVRVITPYPDAENVPSTIFTHPKDTFGQLEVQAWSSDGPRDPRFRPGFSATRWREGPLRLERMSHLTTVVPDLEAARTLYENALEAKTFHTTSTAVSESAFVLVGSETVIELAQPIGPDSALAADLAAHGALPHAATFKVADLDAAAGHARSLGVDVADDGAGTVRLDPAQTFGAVIAFTDRIIPGDPRV
jgi:catechol 2,3-dioxygenase-like lactoylglutathione lyase family enzyme